MNINPNDFIPAPSYSVKIKEVSVRKITAAFGLSRGAAQQICEQVGMKWKLAWLIQLSRKYSWFTIDCIYGKINQTAIEAAYDPKV